MSIEVRHAIMNIAMNLMGALNLDMDIAVHQAGLLVASFMGGEFSEQDIRDIMEAINP